MNKKEYIKAQISIGILCAALAFTVTTQCKSVKINKTNMTLTKDQENNILREENATLKTKNADLDIKVKSLQNDVEAYRKAAEESGNYSDALISQLRRAEVMAGLSNVSGEGIKVTLSDSEKESTEEDMVEDFIIHDSDLRLVITELAAACAEAFSINGQRIVSVTPIRCVGPVITINEVKTAPPFEICAIGDKKTLEAAVNMRGGIADVLSAYGIKVEVQTSDRVDIPMYTGAFENTYALPGGEGETR